jgi:hypothetical protein
MRYALVIFEAQKGAVPPVDSAWIQAVHSAKDKATKSGKVEFLNDSCFLCDLGKGLHDVSSLVAIAAAFGLQTRTLFFDQAPQFVVSQQRP